ncbi:MAG TPA: tetratricopeptide repeat protein [Pyrinomonadaceae bacterium]
MKKVFPLRFALSAVIALTFVPFTIAAKDDWVRVQSENFHLIGNASEKEVRRVATKLEQFREVFKRLFPKLQFVSPVPTTVIVFKSEKSFSPYKPVNASGKATKWVAGYFQSGESSNYIVLSTEGENAQTYRTIFHEYLHFLVNNSFGRSRIPPWFNEGIAEYYEQFAIEEDQKVKLGNLNENHLVTLQQSKLIPFETYFKIDYYSLHQQGGHGANIFYAQSWAFVHYLIHANKGARRTQLDTFLSAIIGGMKPADAFQKAFQTDFASMEKELKKYVEQRQFFGTMVTLSEKLNFDNKMAASAFTEPEAKAFLGDLLVNSNRLTEAEAHLSEALTVESPQSGFAQTSLGMVRMRQKRFPEARQLLEKALAGETSNHLVYYRYAYLLSRESEGADGMFRGFPDETTIKMRNALRKAIQLNPGFPETYGLLAFISLVRDDEVDESIGYINTALKLSPGNEDYILHLAALYSRKNEFDKAQQMAEAVYNSSQEGSTRARAQGVLRNISNFRQMAEYRSQAGQRTGGAPPPGVIIVSGDKPPTPEEIERIHQAAKLQSLNEALRKLKPGEKRVLGTLSKIECGRNGILYTFKAGVETMLLRTKDFSGLELMALVPTSDTPISCEGIPKPLFAVISFVPVVDAKTKTSGEVVSIELVPDDFRFLDDGTETGS